MVSVEAVDRSSWRGREGKSVERERERERGHFLHINFLHGSSPMGPKGKKEEDFSPSFSLGKTALNKIAPGKRSI